MVFSSLIFLWMFLPIVLGMYFLTKESYRNVLLLAASLFFYAWGEPVYVLVMILSIVINYIYGLKIGTEDETKRKRALVGGIVLGRRFLTGRSPLQKKVVLTAEMKPEEGYVSHPQIEPELVGRTALVMAVLRPSGRVMVDGRYYDAAAEDGLFVARGRTVTVTRIEGGVLYCTPQERKTE